MGFRTHADMDLQLTDLPWSCVQILKGDCVKLAEYSWVVGEVYAIKENMCHLLFDAAFAPGSLRGAGIADIRSEFPLASVVKISRGEKELAVRAFSHKKALQCAALAGDAMSWRTLGSSSVAAFRPLMERVACPYARLSQLLGSPDWDWALTVDTNILHCVPNLRLVAEANKSADEPPERLDGLVMEVPIRALGIPSSARTEGFAAAAAADTLYRACRH